MELWDDLFDRIAETIDFGIDWRETKTNRYDNDFDDGYMQKRVMESDEFGEYGDYDEDDCVEMPNYPTPVIVRRQVQLPQQPTQQPLPTTPSQPQTKQITIIDTEEDQEISPKRKPAQKGKLPEQNNSKQVNELNDLLKNMSLLEMGSLVVIGVSRKV